MGGDLAVTCCLWDAVCGTFQLFWFALSAAVIPCQCCSHCRGTWWCPLVQCCIWSVCGPFTIICYLFALPLAVVGLLYDIVLFLWYVQHRMARCEPRKVDAGSLPHSLDQSAACHARSAAMSAIRSVATFCPSCRRLDIGTASEPRFDGSSSTTTSACSSTWSTRTLSAWPTTKKASCRARTFDAVSRKSNANKPSGHRAIPGSRDVNILVYYLLSGNTELHMIYHKSTCAFVNCSTTTTTTNHNQQNTVYTTQIRRLHTRNKKQEIRRWDARCISTITITRAGEREGASYDI